MGLDEAVGRQAADEEGREQYPEGAARAGLVERAERRRHHRDEPQILLRRRLDCALTVRSEPDVGRAVAQHRERDEPGDEQDSDDEGERTAPAIGFRQLRDERQKDQLSGCVARRQHADHQAASLNEPARRDGCAKHQRHHAGADSDDDAPERNELPHLSHRHRGDDARDDHRDRRNDDRPHAEAVDEGGGEWRDQPVESEPHRKGDRDLGGAPAELLFERLEDDARRAHCSRRRQHDEKGRSRDDPAVVEVPRGHRAGERVRKREGRGFPLRLSTILYSRPRYRHRQLQVTGAYPHLVEKIKG